MSHCSDRGALSCLESRERFNNLQSSETNFTEAGVNGCLIAKEGLVLIDSVAINGSDLEKEGMDAYSGFNILLS